MTNKSSSDIPVGTQFSPDLINLEAFLQAVLIHSGDRGALQIAIFSHPVHKTRTEPPSSKRTANLPLEAAVQYGLLAAGSYEATPLTYSLAHLAGQDLFDEFARHIMLNLGGLRVVEGAEQMLVDWKSGLSTERVTGDSLARHLTNQGFQVTEHNTAINTIRMWLAKAGVFSEKGWEVDTEAKINIVGLPEEAISALAGFTDRQLAFVGALCCINPEEDYPAADVRDLAEAQTGLRFGRSSLPNEVLRPLESAGLIQYSSGGTQGGKSATLRTTTTFDADILAQFVRNTVESLDAEVTAYYKTRPEDIYSGLDSKDTYEKGRALEAYAIHIMRLLGLRLHGWRKRAADTTGQAEIDVLLSGRFGGLPTLWQVQCKNTPSGRVDLEDVAKEVGIVPITRATHLLFMANSQFTDDARRFAAKIMEVTSLTIFLLDGSDFSELKASPGKLGAILQQRAEAIIRTRTAQPVWTL